MQNSIIGNLFRWTFYNVVLPIIFPACALWLASCIIVIPENYRSYRIFVTLLNNGVYVFLGASVLISLLYEYEKAKEVFTPFVFLVIFFTVLPSMFLFLSSCNIITSGKSLSQNQNVNLTVLIVSVASSLYINYKILKLKT